MQVRRQRLRGQEFLQGQGWLRCSDEHQKERSAAPRERIVKKRPSDWGGGKSRAAAPTLWTMGTAQNIALAGQATGIRRTVEIAANLAGRLSFVAPLLTRIVIGQAFFLTGRGKRANIENVAGFFTELGIPMPYANAVV